MRNTHLYTLLFLLGLLGASSASAGVFSYVIGQSTGESNARYDADQKAKAEGRISCVPQHDSKDLWTCADAFGTVTKDLQLIPKETPSKPKKKTQ